MLIFVTNANKQSTKFDEICQIEIKSIDYIFIDGEFFEICFYDTEKWSDMAQKLNYIDIDYRMRFRNGKAFLTIKTTGAVITNCF